MYAEVELPHWLWGGNPAGYLKAANLHGRSIGSNRYRIETTENYRHQPPSIATARDIAGPGMAQPRYDDLAHETERVAPPTHARIDRLINEYAKSLQGAFDLPEYFQHERLSVYKTPVPQLPDRVKVFHEGLHKIDLGGTRAFRDSGIQLAQVDLSLNYRLRLPALLLGVRHHPLLQTTDPKALAAQNQQFFLSSDGLSQGAVLLDAYLGPLQASLSPQVWVLPVIRTFGTLLFSLGTPIQGVVPEFAELLQTLPTIGPKTSVPRAIVGRDSPMAAVRWWTRQLNAIFAVLSDPANFVQRDGQYSPIAHLEWQLTVEQLFRRVTSLLLSHRDTTARNVLFFSVLDTLVAVSGIDIVTMCKLTHAKATIASLEQSLEAEVCEVLLPNAHRGVSALQELQDGFFMTGKGTRNRIRIIHDDGTTESELAPEDAAAYYVKALRDATHGHTNPKKGPAPRTRALLVQHDGDIPDALGLLAMLYLVDLLNRPDRLQKIVRAAQR